MSHTFHERVSDTVFTLEHDIYFGIVQIQSPRAPPFQWFKNVMVWIVEVLIALFSKKWSKYAPFPDKPTWKFQRFQCTDRGRRRLIRHGSHENSLILEPLQSVIGIGFYQRSQKIKITTIGEKHRETHRTLPQFTTFFNHIKIMFFARIEIQLSSKHARLWQKERQRFGTVAGTQLDPTGAMHFTLRPRMPTMNPAIWKVIHL